MTLIIAEKPQLASAIADAIPGERKSGSSYISKGQYVITWAFGHLLQLKQPQDYDESYKTWSLDALPIYFENWGKKPNEKKGGSSDAKQRLDEIGKLLKKADSVIHAGDPDDEGQCLIDEILEYFDYRGPVKRLGTRDTTKEKLQKELANMDDNSLHIRAGKSAYARSVADLMVGVNMSRYFTISNPGALLSVGRVQTPTLGLVVNRDVQIENHQKIKYFSIGATVSTEGVSFKAKYAMDKDDPRLTDGRILSKATADDVVNMLNSIHSAEALVTAQEETEEPPLPFNAVELQVYCEKKWGYSPTQTLDITQSLRDDHNAISYNRTNCQYLSSEQYRESPEVMSHVIKNLHFKPPGLDMALRSRAFDDDKIEAGEGNIAHLAIIPQAVNVDLTALTQEEKNVYLAICQYYMAQFMPPALKKITKFKLQTPDGGQVTASSTAIIEQGYRYIFRDKEKDEESDLGKLKPGTHVASLTDATAEEKETQPPGRYTQASLAKDMTRIAKYVDDPRIKQLLIAKDKDKKAVTGENGSIGTDATRPSIIQTLLDRGYIEEFGDGKTRKIRSTPLGRELYRILPDELRKPDMTALWWVEQENIKSGESDVETLTLGVLQMIRNILGAEHPKIDMDLIPAKYKRGSTGAPLGACPRCGESIAEGKRGFGCLGYKSGCKFVIWRQPATALFKKTEVTATQVRALLEGGWTDEVDDNGQRTGCKITNNSAEFTKLYSAEKDKKFSAALKLKDDPNSEYGPSFVFSNEPAESVGKCPVCGGDVTEFSSGFSCENHKTGCPFVLWKTSKMPLLKMTTITAADAKTLLSGKMITKKTLLSKKGVKFQGKLKLAEEVDNKYGAKLVLKL